MANRKPMSEETKKKISEALKKGYGKTEEVKTKSFSRSSEAERLYSQFNNAQTQIDGAKGEIDKIKADYDSKKEAAKSEIDKLKSSISGKKVSKAEKAKVKEKIKELRENAKKEREAAKEKVKQQKELIKQAIKAQKLLREEAKKQKNIQKANKVIEKANQAIQKANLLEKKVKALFEKRRAEQAKKEAEYQDKRKSMKVKDTDKEDDKQAERSQKNEERRKEAEERLKAALQRISDVKVQNLEKIDNATKIIKNGGTVEEKGTFDFMEDVRIHSYLFYERKPFEKWRAFNLLEKRVNFEYLNQEFNDLEAELEMNLQSFMDEEIQKNVQKIKNKIKSGDLAGISTFSIMNVEKLSRIILYSAKQSFEVGKKSASDEMNVPKSATSRQITIILNFEAIETATTIIHQMNTVIRQRAKEEIVKRDIEIKVFADVVVGSFVDMEAVKKMAEKLRNELVGSLVGQKINQGRRFTFEKNLPKIKAYQRTEYLDSRICRMCKSLNARYVDIDDPFAQLEKVHTNCRGFWMPVLSFDPIEGSIGLPKKITNAFDLLDGFPVINQFKQLKKVIS